MNMTAKLGTAALAMVASVMAQSTTKVGTINIQQAILQTRDGQKAAQDLQAKFEPRSKAIQAKNAELQQLQDQFRKSQNTASEDQRNKMAREIDQKQKSLQRDQEDAQQEVEQEQQRVLADLGQKLMAVIDKYARDNQYTLILDVSSPQTPVLYMANGLDITGEVIKLYDANAPASSAAPAGGAAPTMPRPAVPAPKPAPAKPAGVK